MLLDQHSFLSSEKNEALHKLVLVRDYYIQNSLWHIFPTLADPTVSDYMSGCQQQRSSLCYPPPVQLAFEELHLSFYNDFTRLLYIAVCCSQTLPSESQLTARFPVSLFAHFFIDHSWSILSTVSDMKESTSLPNVNAKPSSYVRQ